jgi:hypothetical protein
MTVWGEVRPREVTVKYMLAGAMLLLLIGAASGEDKPKARGTLAERLAALQKEHKDAEEALRKADDALPDTPEGQKKAQELWKDFDKKQGERFLAAVELAKSDPKSDDALAALEWALTIPRSYYLPGGKEAMELVTTNHATNPKVGKIIAWVGYYGPRRTEAEAAARDLIKAVAEKNPDRTARAQAVLAMAQKKKEQFAVAEHSKAADVDKVATEAEKAFDALLKDYGDCPRLIRAGSGTIGDFAKSELFDLRNLRIGKVAPDINAEDLDGTKFKLSDYRGKVVILDFWGDW